MLENSSLFKEIHEQPSIIASLIEKEQKSIKKLAMDIQTHDIDYVMIAARGSSDNAARYAQYLLGSINQLPVALATPSLFTIYQKPPRLKNALVIGISQSGKSPDIVAVLDEARRQGSLTAALTNFPNSDLAHSSEHLINLNCTPEKSIAATKTYTSELVVIALLSSILSSEERMLSHLANLPDQLSETLKLSNEITQIAQRYRYMQSCVVIGRGYNYATAFEIALKLKELTYTVVEPYSSADFLHGPLAMINPGFPIIVIAPTGEMLPELKSFIQTLKNRSAETIVISDDASVLVQARIPLALPVTVPEWLSPVTCIIPGQLLAMYLAHVRDYDLDHPRALSKITETR